MGLFGKMSFFCRKNNNLNYLRVARWLLAALIFSLTACRKSGAPYSPADAIKTFQIDPAYRVEPFASEPAIVSPVAMDFDESGRIFVVEDRGYPLSPEKHLGRVKLLEDTNGDGIPARSTIFADNLTMPTGVMRWKKGVLVTDAPDLIYFEDTDGDGKADIRRVVLTGFAVTNPQHTVNNPVYGLDNWIYIAHENAATAIIFKDKFGDRGSDIRFPDRPGAPRLTEHGRNIRLRPDTNQLEALSGSSQFGQAFDDWGHHFTVSNSDHIRHEVLPARYLKRNPDLPVATVMEQISDHGPAAKVFPTTLHPRFEMLTDVGQFTSACGLTFFRGAMFVAEPVHNLVHEDVLSEAGATFLAKRAREGVEFLSSTDAWFRPVNFMVGPDGALYMMDFYRLAIEHPEWMATETYNSKDLTVGIDRGRIYRIVLQAGDPPGGIRLGNASSPELVQALESPNPWMRRTAQRLLIDRNLLDAAGDLAHLAGASLSPVGRLHALWTLDGLNRLDAGVIEKALDDAEPGVRENAILLAESRLANTPTLADKLIGMIRDPSPKVRFQLLCTLGFVNSPAAQAARDRLLAVDIEDRWVQLAALSVSSAEAPRLFEKALGSLGAGESKGRVSLFRQVCSVIGVRKRSPEIQQVLTKIAASTTPDDAWWSAASLDGLAQGMRSGGHSGLESQRPLLLKIFESTDPAARRAALQLVSMAGLPPGRATEEAVRRAVSIAEDQGANPELRADQIGLLAVAGPEQRQATLKALINPKEPEQVQAAAVRAIGKIQGDDIGRLILANWRAFTGSARTAAADAMYLEPSRVKLLLAALQSGDVQPWTLAFRHKRRLIMHTDPAIREVARPLLEQSAGEREKVVKRYEAALDKKADAARGKVVFKSICAKCHRLGGVGAQVGPDLATVQNRPKQMLLEDILMPSKAIAQGYEAYVVETVSGSTIDGVIGAQTPTSVALRHEDGKEDVIQRKDIKQMFVTNLSAMPGDLEKQIDIQQMADVLEYVKTTH
jgi:putative membrane-bound dehydrogenase-like protein